MRNVCFVVCLAIVPAVASAQQSFTLPSIGLPPPPVVPRAAPWDQRPVPAWERPQLPPWERPQQPAWERQQLPPWEGGRVAKPETRRGSRADAPRGSRPGTPRGSKPDASRGRDGRHRGSQVVYVMQPYAVPVQQPPEVIVVQAPPVTRIVEVPVVVPPPEPEPEPEPALPPYVPTGDRTLYVIPKCYVGNVPPREVSLPPGCDIKKLTTFTP